MLVVFFRVVNVARSVKGVITMRIIHVVAPYIPSHHCKARNAEGGEIYIVT
ncbi:hypothetical protein D3C85_1830430 [compost metagenome]